MTKTSTPAAARRVALALLLPLGGALAAGVTATASAEAVPAGDRLSYVLFNDGNNSTSMSGSMEQLRRAQQVRRGTEGLLYFVQGGSAYVIRDPALLARARALFRPQAELGARQAELGARQAELGARQAKLGTEQGRLGMLQAGATARRQAELGRQQGELGRQQGELGRQQGELGRRQGELGREQGRLAKIADAQLRQLIGEAMRSGLAQRVD